MVIKIKNIHLADSFEIKDKRMLIWGIYFKRKIREEITMKIENISLANLLEIKDRKKYAKASNINFQNLVEKNRKRSIGIPICNLGLQEEQSTRLPVSTLEIGFVFCTLLQETTVTRNICWCVLTDHIEGSYENVESLDYEFDISTSMYNGGHWESGWVKISGRSRGIEMVGGWKSHEIGRRMDWSRPSELSFTRRKIRGRGWFVWRRSPFSHYGFPVIRFVPVAFAEAKTFP